MTTTPTTHTALARQAAEAKLPAAWRRVPCCGVCGDELTDETGEALAGVCEPCGLRFTPQGHAFYLDPTAEPCGAACDSKWHAAGRIRPGIAYACGTCILPAGHPSPLHEQACQQVPNQESTR